LCSKTLRQALERLVRYFELVSNAADTMLEEHSDRLSFIAVTHGDPKEIGHVAIEYGLAALLVLLREVFPRPLYPLRIQLLRPADRASEEFSKLFGCPVVFGCKRESMSFDIELVDELLQGGNETLAKYQDSFSEEYLTRFGNNSTSMKVKNEILRSLPGGNPCQTSVANALHISTRHLQRRLESEKTSFRLLLNDIRKQLSFSYLRQENRSLSEIAYLLGFTDHSNFSRAFKNWFHCCPVNFHSMTI
jgi:AraC-like DNA-binding protein